MSDDDDNDFFDVEGAGTMSRAAFLLHTHGLVNSFQEGTPGFVSDEYLSSIPAETAIPAVELETIGLWERRDSGYFLRDDEMIKRMLDQREHMASLAAECQARGAHTPERDPGPRMTICEHCFVPLARADGGPVALPDGGPLGGGTRTDED